MVDSLRSVRYALRRLRRRPTFAALVVVSLAVGIGANVAIFSLVDAVLLRPLAIGDPDGLILLSHPSAEGKSVGRPGTNAGRLQSFTLPLYQRLHADEGTFAGLAAEDAGGAAAIVRRPRAPNDLGQPADGRMVTANYFEVLGVRAHRGRTFAVQDEGSSSAEVVLSYAYWQRRFLGDPTLIGERLDIGNQLLTVIGVTPPDFVGTKAASATDFWVSLNNGLAASGQTSLREPDRWWLLVMGRLRPGIDLASAEAKVNVVLQNYLKDHPYRAPPSAGPQRSVRIELTPGRRGFSGSIQSLRSALLVLMAGGTVLLITVSLNVSHLLLARAMDRQREISIRSSLGATRWQIVRQFLGEGVVLALLGGGAAVLLSVWLRDALVTMAVRDPTRLGLPSGLDVRSLTFAGALTLAFVFLLGVVPVGPAARTDNQKTLRATALTIAGTKSWLGRLLLVSQVSLSLVLLVGAGLLGSTLGKLRGLDKGLNESQVLLVGINPGMGGIAPPQASQLYESIRREVGALPGVASVSLSKYGPLSSSGMHVGFSLESSSLTDVQVDIVTPEYFDTVGMQLVRGRGFERGEGAGYPVAVVNEALVRRFFPSRTSDEVIDRRFTFDPAKATRGSTGPFRIVGVVKNAKTSRLRQEPPPIIYITPVNTLDDGLLGSIEIRTASGIDPAGLARAVRTTLHRLNPALPITNLRTMQGQIDSLLRRERLLSALSGAFGLLAVLLVSLGLYGIMSQWVTQRIREIGVRMALGATGGNVRWLVLRQALTIVTLGLAVGLPATLFASRLLAGLLYGVNAADLRLIGLATLFLLAVGSASAFLPALRASRLETIVALRTE